MNLLSTMNRLRKYRCFLTRNKVKHVVLWLGIFSLLLHSSFMVNYFVGISSPTKDRKIKSQRSFVIQSEGSFVMQQHTSAEVKSTSLLNSGRHRLPSSSWRRDSREEDVKDNREEDVNHINISIEDAAMMNRIKHDNTFDICVVGSGLSGAVIAERYASQMNKSVYVMEKRDHIGGICYDYMDTETGIRVNKYGAHLFHTKYKRVWDYVQRFGDWTPYEHKVLAYVDGKHVPVPVNIDTVNTLFGLDFKTSNEMDEWLNNEQVRFNVAPKNSEEMSLSRVGKRLHEKLFKPYTIKQWAKTPAQLGPEVMARIPVRNDQDGRYFSDPFQALPTHGYTGIFQKMFDHPLITVRTGVDYFKVRDWLECGQIYFTGPVDTYFAHLGWPKLEYRSLDFVREVHNTKGFYQPNSMVNFPSETVPYTRIVEYKHFLYQKSNQTVIFKEISKDDGEPYYPVPNHNNKKLVRKYKEMADNEKHVTFVGRLANYKYFNMDQSILNALELFDEKTGLPSGAEYKPCG